MDMDFREPERTQPRHPVPDAPYTAPKKSSGKGKKFMLWLLVLLLLAGAGAGGWYYRDTQAKDDAKAKQTEITDLKAVNAKLQSDLEDAKEAAADKASQLGPSEDTLKKVQDAVKSGKYADMQNLMASRTNVIIAASEGLGSRTPAQTVADLKYLDSGTDPWNFALTSAVISGYQDGDYAQYFPVGALVGKSANDYVVSFSFNNAGKINGVFMANKADIL